MKFSVWAVFALVWAGQPLLALAVRPAPQRAVEGIVSKVDDAGSLWLTPPGQSPVHVRLGNIEPPESCQSWGEEARRALAELALHKSATLRIASRDASGQARGSVQVEGIDLATKMVEEGHAWSIRTHWDRGPLVKQELMAKALHRGLHGVGDAVRPADFRRSHGPCAQ